MRLLKDIKSAGLNLEVVSILLKIKQW